MKEKFEKKEEIPQVIASRQALEKEGFKECGGGGKFLAYRKKEKYLVEYAYIDKESGEIKNRTKEITQKPVIPRDPYKGRGNPSPYGKKF